jgi:hypothetical protein
MSDKTGLTVLSGGKEAWPVYATIGNISKHIRRQPSKRAVVLLGYLPIPSSLLDVHDEEVRGANAWEVFHKCLKIMVEPLIKASKEGVEMWCSDGGVWWCYPFLVAYVADHPKQCLVACTSRCPICEQNTKGWGDLGEPAPLHAKPDTLRTLEEAEVRRMKGVNTLGLCSVWPFWTHLDHVNLATAITPDLLHQLHKGMFLNHLVEWCKDLMGVEEMDRRFMAMTRYQGTRHFTNGISVVSQWTGQEAKEMARVFLAVTDGAISSKAIVAVCALLNFMFLAHSSMLTDLELKDMDRSLVVFHENKMVFGKNPDGTHRNFDLIQKLHMLQHYSFSIRELGTPDGYNTETSELLHISLTKNPYRASNKVEPMEQMAKGLEHRDAMLCRQFYLQECGCLHLVFLRSQAGKDEGEGEGSVEGQSEDEDDGIADGKGRHGLSVVDSSLAGRRTRFRRKPVGPYHPRPKYFKSKQSTWPRKPGSCLIDTHKAFDLVLALNDFFNMLLPPSSSCPRILETHLFPCWSQFTLCHGRLPFKPSEPPKCSIVRTAPARFKDGKQTRMAAFDTVLVLSAPELTGLFHEYFYHLIIFVRLPC